MSKKGEGVGRTFVLIIIFPLKHIFKIMLIIFITRIARMEHLAAFFSLLFHVRICSNQEIIIFFHKHIFKIMLIFLFHKHSFKIMLIIFITRIARMEHLAVFLGLIFHVRICSIQKISIFILYIIRV